LLLEIAADKIAGSTAEAFGKLYRQYLPKIFRYISYKINDTHTAEDLTSAVFDKALTKFESYSADKAAFSTWIFAIARNTVIDYFRVNKNSRTSPLEGIQVEMESASPEEEVIRSEEDKILKKCIARLSASEQEIISLKFGAEFTNRQIAKTVGLSESNVGVIIYRTVRKLRENFRELQNEQG